MLAALLLVAQAATPAPPPERLALARQVAEGSGIVAVLRTAGTAEIDALAASDETLTEDDRTALRRIGAARSDIILRRLVETLARGYAERLSDADLRVLVRYDADPAVRRLREAEPAVIAGAAAEMDGIDFKGDVARQLCAERRRLCDRR